MFFLGHSVELVVLVCQPTSIVGDSRLSFGGSWPATILMKNAVHGNVIISGDIACNLLID